QGLDLVSRNRYFTIWAPRQTGKSTYFMMLARQLRQQGYNVMHVNFESFTTEPLPTLMRYINKEARDQWGVQMNATTFGDFFNFVNECQEGRWVFIVDEIEGLNPEFFGQFLHLVRNLYHSRNEHCLKSVILVGVSNIVGVVQDNASPFNVADNLNVPFFTTQETFELMGQHETETGQLFEPRVKEKIAEITANQPGLVNGFARELVERSKGKPVITFEDYLEVEQWYLREAIDKNVANVVNKAKQYRSFVEGLLFREGKVPFNIHREDIRFLYVNGVISKDEEGNVTFKVPLYRKAIHDAFYPYMNGEKSKMGGEIWAEEFLQPGGDKLKMDKLMAGYKSWVQRRSFKYFREKDDQGNYLALKEAALVYSFETYVQVVLEILGGKSYLEAHTGLGRSDLLVHLKGHEYVIEFKVYSNSAKFKSGKKQLAYYCKKMGLSEGHYLVFVPNSLQLPPVVNDKPEVVEDIQVVTWLVFYDEEKDF
ncbi:MAG: AAA-like domain-containing protein, partial [Bacteroidota bacterium]